MATVRFTSNIQRHLACPTREVAGRTLREVLDEYFRIHEQARGYVLDDQGRIRQHMVVFIDGDQFEPNIQDPHSIVQCLANPDVLWVQHHNGIFKSIDAGATWSEIEDVKPAAFGFAVTVHPKDANTAWFIPAVKDEKRYPMDGRIVVNRTRDGGKTFEALRRGLPQEHAYDLVYRHAFDIDESGDRLAFGSTTGSLWLTEDAGDSWQTLSANLPPVYAVRFEKP